MHIFSFHLVFSLMDLAVHALPYYHQRGICIIAHMFGILRDIQPFHRGHCHYRISLLTVKHDFYSIKELPTIKTLTKRKELYLIIPISIEIFIIHISPNIGESWQKHICGRNMLILFQI